MNQVDICISQLITAILESDEYQRYLEIRAKVKEEPEKERAINDFRRKNFELRKNSANIDLFDEYDRFEREYADFRAQPLVNEYLAAELSVCRLFQKINWRLVENVEFDLGFFE